MRFAVRLRILAVTGLLMAMLASAGFLVVPPQPASAAEDTIDLSLRALGYNDQIVTGISPTFDVFFPDLGSQPGDSSLDFIMSHSNLLLPDLSLVSVVVNGTPLFGANLDDRNVNRTSIHIDIPADRLQNGPNRVSFRFLLRLRPDCDGDDSTARNAIIYADTTMHIGAPTNVTAPDLRDFPGQFVTPTRPNAVVVQPPTALKGQPTIAVPLGVAIPPDATPTERNGAATMLLALTSGRPALPIEPRFIATPDVLNAGRNQNIVLVGRAGSIPSELLRNTPFRIANGQWQQVTNALVGGGGRDGEAIGSDAEQQATVANNAGILLMTSLPNDPRSRVFIISGNNDDGITRAISLLNAPNTANLLTGQGAIIADVAPTPPAPTGPVKLSLNDLGITDAAATVTGLGTHDIASTFVVTGPFTDNATIQIDFASAPTLEPKLSNMTTLINDQPFITQMLDGKNGERRLLTAVIPPNLFRPGRNTIRFSFQLQGQAALTCRSEFNGPYEWATLYNPSNLNLPPVARDIAFNNYALSLYPFPFATGNDPMNLVVTDLRDPDSLTTAFRLAVNAGAVAPRGLTARLMTAAEATPQVLRGQNAIVIGPPSANPLLDPVSDQLFFVNANGVLRLRNTPNVNIVGATAPTGVSGNAPAGTPAAPGGAAPAPGSTAAGGTATTGGNGSAPAATAGGITVIGTPAASGTLGPTVVSNATAAATAGGVATAVATTGSLPTQTRPAGTSAAIGGGDLPVVLFAAGTPEPTLTGAPTTAPGAVSAFAGGGTGPVGVLQILPAPWDNTKLMLVVAGANQEMRALAVDALTRGKFTAREAVISKDSVGQLVVGEARPIALATILPPVSTAVPTVLIPGGAIVPPGAVGGPTLPPAIASAFPTNGTVAVPPSGMASSGGSIIPNSTIAPVNATASGSTTAGTARPVGTTAAGTTSGTTIANAPAVAGTTPTVAGGAANTTPGVATAVGSTPVSGTPGTRSAGTGTAAAGGAPIVGAPVVIGTPGPGTPAASAAAGGNVAQVGTTPSVTVPPVSATKAATSGGDKIFGLSRTVVFGIMAAAVLALGIVVVALVLQGQRRGE